jgi:hypothetical protein
MRKLYNRCITSELQMTSEFEQFFEFKKNLNEVKVLQK